MHGNVGIGKSFKSVYWLQVTWDALFLGWAAVIEAVVWFNSSVDGG